MKTKTIGVAFAALLNWGCGGEDGGAQFCEILFPIAAAALGQSDEGLMEYCLECEVGGETYLVTEGYWEGITATPIQQSGQSCGNLQITTSPLVRPGRYTIDVRTYRVDDYGYDGEHGSDAPAYAYRPAAALGPIGATLTIDVTGEDCFDGTDDDGDGATDCDDLDNCTGAPACSGIEECTNLGHDDDADGAADCDDTDCQYNPGCME